VSFLCCFSILLRCKGIWGLVTHSLSELFEQGPASACYLSQLFAGHQKLITHYHSNFLIWFGLHAVETSLFGSGPDFCQPPSTPGPPPRCNPPSRAEQGDTPVSGCSGDKHAIVLLMVPYFLGITRENTSSRQEGGKPDWSYRPRRRLAGGE